MRLLLNINMFRCLNWLLLFLSLGLLVLLEAPINIRNFDVAFRILSSLFLSNPPPCRWLVEFRGVWELLSEPILKIRVQDWHLLLTWSLILRNK